MKNLFSFSYLTLGIGLVLIAIGVFVPNEGSYFWLIAGGIAFTTTFASFGNHDYRGSQSKKIYRIIRYILAALLIFLGLSYIMGEWMLYNHMMESLQDTDSYTSLTVSGREVTSKTFTMWLVISSISTIIADSAVVAYLLMFKPSGTTTGKKIMKLAGYILILSGTSYLCGSKITYLITGSMVELAIYVCIIIAGIALTVFGRRKSPVPCSGAGCNPE